jgi:tetratricopeptide (TPR) repeat protein
MPRHPSAKVRGLLILSCLLAASVALAAGAQEKADELAHKGIDLRRRGDDQGALPLFQEAHRIAPTPRSAVQLGTVEQAVGRWADAEEHITQGLRSPDDPWIKKNRAVIDEALRSVKGHIASVEVTGDPVGAEVLVNGKKVGVLPLAGAVRVNAGDAYVEVTAAGYRRGSRSVTVPAGEYQTVVLRLEKIDQPPPPPPPPPTAPTAWQKWAAYGAFGGAAIAAGVGTYGVVSFNDKVGTFNEECGQGSSGPVDKKSGAPSARCNSLQSDYKGARTLAIVGYSVAGALAATGVVLLLTAPDAPANEQVSWACAPTLGRLGAACGVRF